MCRTYYTMFGKQCARSDAVVVVSGGAELAQMDAFIIIHICTYDALHDIIHIHTAVSAYFYTDADDAGDKQCATLQPLRDGDGFDKS